MTRRAPRSLAGGAGAIVCAAAALFGTAIVADRPALAAATPQVVMFFTGSGEGYLEQCGCTRFPLGGLDRRAGVVREVRRRWPRAAAVALEIGNFADSPGGAGEIKTRGLVRAMNKLGYSVSGVGERELLGGPDGFQQLMNEARFPFISTNLVRAKSGTTWLQANAVLSAGGVKVGVLSVTRHNPALRLPLPDGDAVVTVDPVMALQSQVQHIRSAVDVVVVLAALPIEEARLIARRVHGIDIMLGAHGGRVTGEPVVEGFTQIVYAGDEGKYLGRVDVFHPTASGPVSFEASLAPLDEQRPVDTAMATLVVEVMAQAQDAERQRPADTGADGRHGFLGAGACSACHPGIVSEWAKTDHARAWQGLTRKGPVQASCVACHVTGFGQPGGFKDPSQTPHLLGVGCESCHGPGASHVAQPGAPYGKVTLATCTPCHTAEMDPRFNFYEYRQLVRHSSSER